MSEGASISLDQQVADVAAELDRDIAADAREDSITDASAGMSAEAIRQAKETIESDERLIGAMPTERAYKSGGGVKKLPSRLVLPCTYTQLKVFASRAKYQSLFTTRRWGKTTFACLKVIDKVKRANPLGLIWWVAPTYKQCKKPFRTLLSALHRAGLLAGYSKGGMVLRTVTGWTIEFRSGDVPDNLRGDGVDLLIIDEQGQISDETWDECLFPTLADTDGDFLGIGTPKGRRGWAYKRYRLGLDPANKALYYSQRFTAYDAVFIPKHFLDEARKHMPKKAFEQEFMAQFLDGLGVVFEDLRTAPRLTPIAHEGVGIGIDWAKKRDWTWFTAVGAKSGCVIDKMRVPQLMPYAKQVEMAANFAKKVEGMGHRVKKVVHDQTGVGEAIDELLRASALKKLFEGLVFTYQSKKDLVEEGIVAFEAGKLGFTSEFERDTDGETMLRELEDYSLEITKTGRVIYGAPDGFHDDAVTSILLANRARREAALVPTATAVKLSQSFTTGQRLFPTIGRIFN